MRYVRFLKQALERFAEPISSVQASDWTRLMQRSWTSDYTLMGDAMPWAVLAAWRTAQLVQHHPDARALCPMLRTRAQAGTHTSTEPQVDLNLDVVEFAMGFLEIDEGSLIEQEGLPALAGWQVLEFLCQQGQPPTSMKIREMALSLAIVAQEAFTRLTPLGAYRHFSLAFDFHETEFQAVVKLAGEVEAKDPLATQPEALRTYLTRRTLAVADRAEQAGERRHSLAALKLAAQLHGLTRTRGEDVLQRLLDEVYQGEALPVASELPEVLSRGSAETALRPSDERGLGSPPSHARDRATADRD